MASTVQSRKSKGRRLQQLVVSEILKIFPLLTERDVKSQPMGVTGSDVVLSEAAATAFPYSVECKNTEKLNIWSALEQSESENRTLTPVVIFKRNRSKVYITMELDKFMKLLKDKLTSENCLQEMIEDAAGPSL